MQYRSDMRFDGKSAVITVFQQIDQYGTDIAAAIPCPTEAARRTGDPIRMRNSSSIFDVNVRDKLFHILIKFP